MSKRDGSFLNQLLKLCLLQMTYALAGHFEVKTICNENKNAQEEMNFIGSVLK